jgi:LPXTG-site transpeptidase (sortase) family protein
VTAVAESSHARVEVTTAPSKKPHLSSPRRVAANRTVSIALIALLVMSAFWIAFQLFEGPVATFWYTTRQHQLASQLEAARPHTGKGAAIAVLQIPRLGTNLVIAEGDAPQQLRSGPGHRIGTPQPGDVGNSVIVAHRSGWGGPFADLGQLKTDDLVVVQTRGGDGTPRNGVFKVVSIAPGAGGDDLVPFSSSTDRRLTLVAGTGGQFSNRRLVVTAVSGTVGKVHASSITNATTSSGSALWNPEMLLVLLGIGGAITIGLAIRRRYSTAVVVTVVTPLVALGLLGIMLEIDNMVPAVR